MTDRTWWGDRPPRTDEPPSFQFFSVARAPGGWTWTWLTQVQADHMHAPNEQFQSDASLLASGPLWELSKDDLRSMLACIPGAPRPPWLIE